MVSTGILLGVWWWCWIACVGKGGGPGSSVPDDTGSAVESDDSGVPSDDEDWPPLQDETVWRSEDRGYATGLAWADIDGDDDGDLVVAYGNDMEPGPLVVYENIDGELETTPSWISDEDAFHGHVTVGDVNGDGWTDVAVSVFLGDARFDEPGGVTVYENLGGELSPFPTWEASGFYTFSCALGDVDLDGDLDLAVAVGEAYYNEPDVSRVFVNDGTGDFGDAPGWTTETPRHSFDVAWTDLDGDGWLDLAFANSGSGHTVYHNTGGSLPAAADWTAPGDALEFEGNTVDWGDIDGDGLPDLVISDNNQLGGRGTVRAWCGVELLDCWESMDPAAYQSAVSVEDVDGDGDDDVVAGAWWGAVRIYDNTGTGIDGSPTWTSSEDDIVVEAMAWEDVDGSHWEQAEISGSGLVPVPGRGRVLTVTGGVAGDGWVSGPGSVSATYLRANARDLAVSDWDPDGPNRLYGRE